MRRAGASERVPLSGAQRHRLALLRNPNNEVFVLDNTVNTARCLVIYANEPERLDRVSISAGGKIVSKITYRQAHDPVATVA